MVAATAMNPDAAGAAPWRMSDPSASYYLEESLAYWRM